MKCHSPGVQSAPRGKPLAELVKGDWVARLHVRESGGRRRAEIIHSPTQHRDSLQALAKTDWSSLSRDASPEFAERQVRLLNCAPATRATRTKMPGRSSARRSPRWSVIFCRASVQVEQSRPLLTWVGEKLQTDWMAQFIAGKVEYKPRPGSRRACPHLHRAPRRWQRD
jgi:hypothetical protein